MTVQVTYPGVYVDEIPGANHSIPSIPLSITSFMGNSIKGPVNTPTRIQSLTEYGRVFGGLWEKSPMSYAIQQYFNNGGADSYIMRVTAPNAAVSYTELACPGKLVLLTNISAQELEKSGKAGVKIETVITPTASKTDPSTKAVTNSSSFDLTVTRFRASGNNDVSTYTSLNTIPGDQNNIHTRLEKPVVAALQVMPNTPWPTLQIPTATTKPITREQMNAETGEIVIPVGDGKETNLLLQVNEEDRDGFEYVSVVASTDNPTTEFTLEVKSDYGQSVQFYENLSLIDGAPNSVEAVLSATRDAYIKVAELLPNSIPAGVSSPASTSATVNNPFKEIVYSVESELILGINPAVISPTKNSVVSVEIAPSTSEPNNPDVFNVIVHDSVGGFEYQDVTMANILTVLSTDNKNLSKGGAAVIAYPPLPSAPPTVGTKSESIDVVLPTLTLDGLVMTLNPKFSEAGVVTAVVTGDGDKIPIALELSATDVNNNKVGEKYDIEKSETIDALNSAIAVGNIVSSVSGTVPSAASKAPVTTASSTLDMSKATNLSFMLKPGLAMGSAVTACIIKNVKDPTEKTPNIQYLLKLEAPGTASETYILQDYATTAVPKPALLSIPELNKLVNKSKIAVNVVPLPGGTTAIGPFTDPKEPGASIDSASTAIEPRYPVNLNSEAELLLRIDAANPGDWGNNICISVSKPGASELHTTAAVAKNLGVLPSDLFNLTVHDRGTGNTEKFLNLTVTKSDNRIDTVINNNSKIVAYDKSISLPPMVPASNAPALSGDPIDWKSAIAPDNLKMSGSPPNEKLTSQCYVLDEGSDGSDIKQEDVSLAIDKFDSVVVPFSLMCIPPGGSMTFARDLLWDGNNASPLQVTALNYCAKNRAMLILDPSVNWKTTEQVAKAKLQVFTPEGALYYPFINAIDPLNPKRILSCAPCGAIAGVIARIDASYGIWRAPAGEVTPLAGITGYAAEVDNNTSAVLNPMGINVLRKFPGVGDVVWGARTIVGADALQSEYKYIPVRRLTSYIETSLKIGLHFAVFEPNNEALWKNLTFIATQFLQGLFEQGAFQGPTAKDSYFVKCDAETTTAKDIEDGIANLQIGIAPVKPAEFIVIKLSQLTGQSAA